MREAVGEYHGAALHSFFLALGHSESLVAKVLRDCGVDRIDPDKWYDQKLALAIYKAIGDQIGRNALIAVGKRMIETAPFPPGLDDVETILGSLDAAYRMNVRGPDLGQIEVTFDDENSATIHWSTPGPCALNIGIIEGCCSRAGKRALVEHGATGCMDKGAPSCIYRVSF